ncbi:MAG: NAD(+)/NADH kinase [Planctomycetes bacterium]|nr:NAD(+)/NADH kinase [Planctomycetota bacterium]MBI3847483.1 NAD(+)/NADH kinase [Planctomycetota bacterium]
MKARSSKIELDSPSTKRVRRLLIVGNGRKPGVREAVAKVRPWLLERVRIVAEDLEDRLDLRKVRADLAVIFGGDGSIIATARRLGDNPVPVLGINFGKFGFLTELSYPQLEEDLERALGGGFDVRPVMMLRCEIAHAGERKASESYRALNDVVLRGTTRMIELRLEIDGDHVTTYSGDGLVVSTPTGSTAHSLAAGGPIVHPDLQAFIFSPICPHSLTIRPLVTPGEGTVRVVVRTDGGGATATVDGQVVCRLGDGSEVRVRRSSTTFRRALLGRRSYYEMLRTKFNWGGQPNYESPH